MENQDALNYVNEFFSCIGSKIDESIGHLPSLTKPPEFHTNTSLEIPINYFNPDAILSQIEQINHPVSQI